MSSLMVCDVSVPVLLHCDHALSVMAAGLLQHGVLFLTVIRSFVRIHLETMQIFLCSLSVFNSLTYFYLVGVHGSVLLRVLYLMLIVSDSCIELDISENPCKLVSVSTSVLYVPSDVLGLLYSFPIPFLDSAFVRLSDDF